MFNFANLFPQLSVFGFFGNAPAKHANPFIAAYIDTDGRVSPFDMFQTDPEQDQFLF